MKNIFYPIYLSLFLFSNAYSQFSFVDQTELYLGSADYGSRITGVTDIDNDGLDDIVLIDEVISGSFTRSLKILYQNEPNALFTIKTLADIGSQSQFSICIADLNNNGHQEAIIGGVYGYSEIIATNNMDGDTSLIGLLPLSEEVFFQGTNIVDINNDGLLDVFACHDDGANYIWENEGEDQFKVNTDWIDFSINGSIDEPASGNYGSIWTDIDFDGDLDLYIAKCRHNVFDSTDVRRINTLYINNGDGTFTEKAEEAGLAIGWQSWTADFQDINNDGHFDVFVTNHDHKSQILLNDGSGKFTEIHDTGIIITEKAYQGILRDFDNDGWVDIFVSGIIPQLFINNKDSTFTELVGEYAEDPVRSFAIGDLNNDGFLDAYVGYRWGGDKIWINSAESENNYLSVRLQGRISNKSAIGARVEIYGDWGLQIREIRSGESYGIMNSMTQYFGLGKSETIDSVIIRWPSGIIQTEYNVDINSKILIKEKCSFAAPNLNIVQDQILCMGDSIILNPEGEFVTYEWSNGSTNPELMVTTDGSYFVMLEDDNGCTATSPTINILFESIPTPTIANIGDDIICEGEETILIITHQNDVENQMWSDGSQGDSLVVTESGSYTFIQENVCGTFSSNQIEITIFESDLNPSIELIGDDIICEGEEVILITTHQANVENQMWSDGSQGDTLIVNQSGEYTYIQEDMCDSVSSNQIEITVLDIPLAPITFNDSIIIGEVAILIAEGTGISWYADNISEEVIATGNEYEVQNLEESTSFYASQSNGDGLCESQRTQTFAIVKEEVSTLEIDTDQVFKITPNPVNEILNIKLQEDIDLPVSIEIFDSNSRLVTQKSLNKLDTSFDVSGFEKGVYIISIQSKGSVVSKSVVIY